jgi:nucleotide-binding universal stress UspA family protein
MIAIRTILVATDFSETSETAVVYGQTLAGQFKATLHVVHVVENIALRNITAEGFLAVMPELQRELEEAAGQQLEEVLARLRTGGLSVQGRIITSSATAEAIVTYARDLGIDLIVIGTHGQGGMARLLLGSVAERVVRTAPCPVLTVHHPEREIMRPDGAVA